MVIRRLNYIKKSALNTWNREIDNIMQDIIDQLKELWFKEEDFFDEEWKLYCSNLKEKIIGWILFK